MMKQIDMAQMPRKELEKFAMEASGEAERLRAVVEAKEAELRLLRKEKFAGKSEKSRNDNVDEAQLSFFNDAEALARPDAEELKLEKVKPPRKPKKKGRKKEKLEKLPVKRTEYVLSEEEAVCPQCGSGLAQMKKTVRKEVEIIPAKVVVHEHITQHYVCRECEKKELHTPILQAESPKPLLAGSFLSPSMAAYVIDRKFENRDPVYKISSDFKSHALNLSDQTISNWILRTSEVYGRPLYERMWDHLLKSDYINADETTVQVLVAARAMKMGAETLKPYLTGAGIESKGTVVIGTVAGDLHDIGKNLVRMMMESKGFEVIDLGVDVPEQKFLDVARENNAKLVCCSALLTTTMEAMARTVELIKYSDIADKLKIMVGGAPVTQRFSDSIGADCYTVDAVSAAEAAVKLVS